MSVCLIKLPMILSKKRALAVMVVQNWQCVCLLIESKQVQFVWLFFGFQQRFLFCSNFVGYHLFYLRFTLKNNYCIYPCNYSQLLYLIIEIKLRLFAAKAPLKWSTTKSFVFHNRKPRQKTISFSLSILFVQKIPYKIIYISDCFAFSSKTNYK